MEILFLIAIGLFGWWVFKPSPTPTSRPSAPDNNRSRNTKSTQDPKHKPAQKTFRPTNAPTTTNTGKLKFRSSGELKSGSAPSGTPSIDLNGIVDAFTGIQINISKPTYSCICGVFYQQNSFELLQAENHSNCVACGKSNITPYLGVSGVKTQTPKAKPKNYTPNIVTLANYKSFINQVVTFEGTVQNINVSRRGTDYAVMFENKTWAAGFKVVFFKGGVTNVGGPTFVQSLKNKKIRVRGLLIKHQTFGYQIIINDRAMILDIS